ncbi:type II toxin-antitoxin system RelE/ParE family toxin [Demequina rhizosphaerae]|uniref:type II toxin-antitoxin system RelE/ParE family toxin n=1 Tax=Demequina rhizosphaerae TaxID=1638985 RepID=UPI000782D4E0|nr:type II toxin-antitoxin system RelE/ParE family toxin [Demequina rhizosphaerae]
MSPIRLVTTHRADEDIATATAHYVAHAGIEPAVAFIDALEAAMRLLADNSAIGSTRFAIATAIPDLRGLALPSLPFVILYTADADALRIHRVLHTARDLPQELDDRS